MNTVVYLLSIGMWSEVLGWLCTMISMNTVVYLLSIGMWSEVLGRLCTVISMNTVNETRTERGVEIFSENWGGMMNVTPAKAETIDTESFVIFFFPPKYSWCYWHSCSGLPVMPALGFKAWVLWVYCLRFFINHVHYSKNRLHATPVWSDKTQALMLTFLLNV